MNWYLEVLKKYAVFSGRARRKEYWMFFLFNMIICFILMLVEVFAGIAPESNQSVLAALYMLAVLLPWLAVGVRRLHDTGRSGWWLLINFVPIIGGIVFLVFMVQDSHPGENQYGPNPKAAVAYGGAAFGDGRDYGAVFGKKSPKIDTAWWEVPVKDSDLITLPKDSVREVVYGGKAPASQPKPQPARPNPSPGSRGTIKPASTLQKGSGMVAHSNEKRPLSPGQETEDQLYEKAWDEVVSGNTVTALWAKAFAESDGDLEKTKARYIAHRVGAATRNADTPKAKKESALPANASRGQEGGIQSAAKPQSIVQTGKEGRFISYSNGTVLDSRTRLIWAAEDNGSDINWLGAKMYCENYSVDKCTDWRMPTWAELAELYDESRRKKATQRSYDVRVTELIRLSTGWVWASDTRASEAAYYRFNSGGENWINQANGLSRRALPVRSLGDG